MAAKGQPKTGGRQKGTPNKTTQQHREALALALGPQIEQLPEVLERMKLEDPKAWADTISKFMPYFMPKMSEVTANGSVDLNRSLTPEEAAERFKRFIDGGK